MASSGLPYRFKRVRDDPQSPFYFWVCAAVPPAITSRGGTVTVVVNEAARLECKATGVPQPSLTWLKDGSPVASVSHGLQVHWRLFLPTL